MSKVPESVAQVGAGLCMFRIQSDGQLIVVDGLLVSLQARTNKSPHGKGRSVIRLRVRAPIEVDEGFIKASFLLEEDAGLVGCITVGGIEIDRMLKTKKCFAHAPRFNESVAHLPPEIGVVRLELHCLVEGLEGLVPPFEVQ